MLGAVHLRPDLRLAPVHPQGDTRTAWVVAHPKPQLATLPSPKCRWKRRNLRGDGVVGFARDGGWGWRCLSRTGRRWVRCRRDGDGDLEDPSGRGREEVEAARRRRLKGADRRKLVAGMAPGKSSRSISGAGVVNLRAWRSGGRPRVDGRRYPACGRVGNRARLRRRNRVEACDDQRSRAYVVARAGLLLSPRRLRTARRLA